MAVARCFPDQAHWLEGLPVQRTLALVRWTTAFMTQTADWLQDLRVTTKNIHFERVDCGEGPMSWIDRVRRTGFWLLEAAIALALVG